MVDATLEHQTLGLSGGALVRMLFSIYVGIVVYGIWAAIVEIPTFVIIGSSTFAIAWASTVAFFGFGAALGVARTWGTGRFRLEKWSTALFMLAFIGYSFALIFRAATTGNWDAAPLAVIPVILCIPPSFRWLSLVVHGHDRIGHRRKSRA